MSTPDAFPSVAERSSAVGLRRGIGFLLGTLLVPGSVQVFAGNRRVGIWALRIWGAVVALIVGFVILTLVNRGAAIGIIASGTFLRLLQPLLIVLGAGWAALFVDAWRLARPMSMQRNHRIVFAVTALGTASALAWGAIAVGGVVGAQGTILSSVLGGGGSNAQNDGRYNILLLGGDAGDGRVGLRPDSITVASVDADTGRTVLFGLPRNLEDVPFPESNPLHALYPNGYTCEDHSCMLNAVYTLAHDHKDLFPGVEDPGLTTTREVVETILGLRINYYAMVDMEGFQALIDAVGGITLDINKRVPIGGGTSPIKGWIEPGKGVKLDGYRALWFARSRQGSTDYERMLRQKCVMNAMLKQLTPVTVLRKFSDLAAAGGRIVQTDVPSKDVNMLMELALKAKDQKISSVSFAPPLVYPGN
ncbi:MAG TPA: LCP family protein, partial [Propionibacteriaceae bacterium]|nr:LCP family protein [Propionibacteriaceae bacterium]